MIDLMPRLRGVDAGPETEGTSAARSDLPTGGTPRPGALTHACSATAVPATHPAPAAAAPHAARSASSAAARAADRSPLTATPPVCTAAGDRSTATGGLPEAGERERLTLIATAAVALSELAPELVRFGADIREGAASQREQARSIAGATAGMTAMLTEVTAGLRDSSRGIGKVAETIAGLASQTRLVSINASIEAARAGSAGAVFGVVAEEVQRLAHRTSGATREVEGALTSISSGIDRAAASIGTDRHRPTDPARGSGAVAGGETLTLAQVNARVHEVAAEAEAHHARAAELEAMGERVRLLCESLLLSVGTFRFDAHTRALDAFEAVLEGASRCGGATRIESYLRETIRRHGFFELVYATDTTGRQTVENVAPGEFRASYGSTGYGRDWSDRVWFRRVAETGGTYVSDIYRSAATDNFCFTLSGPLRDPDGMWTGVLAADVSFSRIL